MKCSLKQDKLTIGRMVEDAEAKGANAVIAFRLSSASVMQGAAEMLAYGTAVVLEDDNSILENKI